MPLGPLQRFKCLWVRSRGIVPLGPLRRLCTFGSAPAALCLGSAPAALCLWVRSGGIMGPLPRLCTFGSAPAALCLWVRSGGLWVRSRASAVEVRTDQFHHCLTTLSGIEGVPGCVCGRWSRFMILCSAQSSVCGLIHVALTTRMAARVWSAQPASSFPSSLAGGGLVMVGIEN